MLGKRKLARVRREWCDVCGAYAPCVRCFVCRSLLCAKCRQGSHTPVGWKLPCYA